MDERAAWVRESVDAWEGRLVAYATRLLGGDRERARDVVQDVFLRLWQADRDEVEDHLAAWLYTVCRRRVIDLQRKEGRMRTTDDVLVLERGAGGLPSAAAPEPPGVADGGEAVGLLGAVSTLPDRQQEAVRLRFQGGLSYADIARVMDTSVSNVGVLLHTAIKRLRDRLDPSPEAAHETGGAA